MFGKGRNIRRGYGLIPYNASQPDYQWIVIDSLNAGFAAITDSIIIRKCDLGEVVVCVETTASGK